MTVTWSATGGSITAGGLYTAGSDGGDGVPGDRDGGRAGGYGGGDGDGGGADAECGGSDAGDGGGGGGGDAAVHVRWGG